LLINPKFRLPIDTRTILVVMADREVRQVL
jgi:hypothetical protein